jgi:tetratricopeptide (TPR) repeat protein
MDRERISFFENKLELEPDNIFYRFSLGQVLFEQKIFEVALPHFQKCVESKPDWLIAHMFLAKSEIELKNYSSARSSLTKAINLAEEQNHETPLEEAEGLLSDIARFIT